jgi:hypothetical protein
VERITLCGLIKIELPGKTVLISDGGFVTYAGDTYQSEDDEFGVISGFEVSGTGPDQAPGGKITFLTPSSDAAARLVSPGFQTSRLSIWLAEVDEATATVIGTPTVLTLAQLDRGVIRETMRNREVDLEFVSLGERLMTINEGNSLNGTFHKRIFAGELGLDNAIGMGVTVAWGAAAPPRGVTTGGGGGGRGLNPGQQAVAAYFDR